MIYLATPYSHNDPSVRKHRFDTAVAACAILAKASVVVYSPIVHWHPVEIAHGLEFAHAFWKFNDCAMMDLASCGLFMKFDGWSTSAGMKHEEAYMHGKGKSAYWATFEELPHWIEHVARLQIEG